MSDSFTIFMEHLGLIVGQEKKGISKYGSSVTNSPGDFAYWAIHAVKENIDFNNYVLKQIRVMAEVYAENDRLKKENMLLVEQIKKMNGMTKKLHTCHNCKELDNNSELPPCLACEGGSMWKQKEVG